MSARLLQHLWRWQRCTSLITQRLDFHVNAQSYATKVSSTSSWPGAASFPQPQSLLSIGQRYSTEQATTKEAQPPSVSVLLERLEVQYKQYGKLHAEQFEQLLTQLEAQESTLNAAQANFLLGSCGALMPAQQPAARLSLFARLWHWLQQRNLLTKEHYHTQLQVLQENRAALPDFQAYLRELSELDAAATTHADVYADMLATVCSNGNMRQATEVLAAMRTQKLPLTERNFNALLLGHGRNHDLQGCQSVLDSMLAAGVSLSTNTQTTLVVVYLENGATAQASDVLLRFHRQFDATQTLRMLRTAIHVELDEAMIVQLVRELPAEFTSGGEVPLLLRNLCIELLHNGKLPTVITIMATLPTPTFNENQDIDTFGVFLLHELHRTQVTPAQVLDFANLLKQSGKNTRALHLATEMALRRNPPAALPLLEALVKEEPLRPHYFWPLLMHNFRRDGELGMLRTLQSMTQLGVECDEHTLRQYVLPRLTISLEDVPQTVKWLDDAGLKPSLVLPSLLAHLLLQQQMEAAQQLVQLYPTKLPLEQLLQPLASLAVHIRATKRYAQYAKLLAALNQKSQSPKTDFVGQLLLHLLNTQARLRSDPPALRRLVVELQKSGLTLSPTALEAIKAALPPESAELQQTLQKMREDALDLPTTNVATEQSGGSSFIKHPRDMSLDELECHLIELESKRMNARGVLRRLLQLCVRDGRLQRALELKAKCDELQVQVSPGMLASVFDLYIKVQDLPKAQRTLQSLQQSYPGFQIDEHKLIDYAALLVHSQQVDTAKQLLQQRASTQRINGGDYVLKNVWNYLNAVAQLAATQTPPLPAESNWTRDAHAFLQRLGYCGSHNAILGPIVRECLLRNDIHAAVAEFQRLAQKYKHTPLQFELLSLLVRLSNAQELDAARYAITPDEAQQLLTNVTATIAKVHSGVNMNSALLLAFAESGTDNQLRRLLINPEFRINEELLLKNCEHLGQEGAVQTLLRLGRGARGLSRVVDEQGIYNMLLQHLVNSNNYVAALDLFERLEADDELKISQEFLRKLVKLLQLNNVEIPSNIRLRAQVL